MARVARLHDKVDRLSDTFAISLAAFGFNLFGDSVRDALDPKLRSQ